MNKDYLKVENGIKDYLKLANEITEKIRTIKSEECIMHYDDKTKIIEELNNQILIGNYSEDMVMLSDFKKELLRHHDWDNFDFDDPEIKGIF